MFAMAVSADRRIKIALFQRDRVDTARKFRGDLLVTLGTSARLVLLINFGASHNGAIHLVRAVAIHAVGCLGLACVERSSMDTLVK